MDKDFTLWDRFEVKGDMTLEELIEYFKVKEEIIYSYSTFEIYIIARTQTGVNFACSWIVCYLWSTY